MPRALRPAYSAAALRAALADVLGPRLLRDSSKRLVIPAWDVRRGDVHLFKTPHHTRLRRDGALPMVDVAMATTAAPTFFQAAHVDGLRLIDGGVWANNPSVVAIGEAVSMLSVPLKAIRVLNVGTIDQRKVHPQSLDAGGWANWAGTAAPLLISASSRGAQGTATHLVGKENFVRFDAVVPDSGFALDRANPAQVAGLASGESRVLSPLFTERFADYIATPYTPAFSWPDPTSGPQTNSGGPR